MANEVFSQFYQNIEQWLKDVKDHEITDLVTFVEQGKKLLLAAEQLPEEKVNQFVDNFRLDLQEFYGQYQEQAKHSIYLGLLQESWWQYLADMTDRSQVEWLEISEDFKHDGVYKKGDMIGFGLLSCRQCHQRLTITHLTEVSECIHCGHQEFSRLSLTP